jgi:hypothetical protein
VLATDGRFWNTSAWHLLFEMDIGVSFFSGDGKRVYAFGNTGGSAWDIVDRKLIWRQSRIAPCFLDPLGRFVVTDSCGLVDAATGDPDVDGWKGVASAETRRKQWEAELAKKQVCQYPVAISPDGKYIGSVENEDRSQPIFVRDVATWKVVQELLVDPDYDERLAGEPAYDEDGQPIPVEYRRFGWDTFAWSAGGRSFAGNALDGSAYVIDTSSLPWRLVRVLHPVVEKVEPEFRFVTRPGSDNLADVIREPIPGSDVKRYPHIVDAVSNDGRFLVESGVWGIRVVRVGAQADVGNAAGDDVVAVIPLPPDKSYARSIAFSPDGRLVAMSSAGKDDHAAHVWRLPELP